MKLIKSILRRLGYEPIATKWTDKSSVNDCLCGEIEMLRESYAELKKQHDTMLKLKDAEISSLRKERDSIMAIIGKAYSEYLVGKSGK